eukprot:7623030-Prorocentrum_lima.AAC.1
MAASSASATTPPPQGSLCAADAMDLDEAWVTKFTDIVAPYIPSSSASGGPASSTQHPTDSSMPGVASSG